MDTGPIIFLQDEHRVIYRKGDYVYKKRKIGLEYEGRVGLQINSLSLPHCVRTVAFETQGERSGKDERLVIEYVEGVTWTQAFNRSLTLRDSLALTLRITNLIAVLPFTHYDLHMNNIIVMEGGEVKLIDFGFSAVRLPVAPPLPLYVECTHSTLSCGILSSVPDPGYDKMMIVLSINKQAKRFKDSNLIHLTGEAIRKARFDHPLFYGRENFIPYEIVSRYACLLYAYKAPILPSSERRISYALLLNELEELRREAGKVTNWLLVPGNEIRVYDLFYSYKREMIATRRVPSYSEIRDWCGG